MVNETTSLVGNGGGTSVKSSSSTKIWIFLTAFFALCTSGLLILFLWPSSGNESVLTATHSHPKYKATQFISFSINTMGGLADKGECEGLVVDEASGTCYLGNQNNMTEDLQHRVTIIAQVIQALRADAFQENPVIDHSDTTLKVMMFPEFFIRGPNGAYSTIQLMEDGALMAMAEEIGQLVSDPEFSDYLFVMGTVIAAQSPGDPRKPWHHANHDEVEYFNFAPVYKGGPHPDHHILVTKKYISGADFLDRVSLPDPVAINDYSHRQYDALPEDFLTLLKDLNVTVETDNLFEFDGVRIGLEICLDHRMGALWHTIQQNHEDLVDVHLIISAGMSIERGPNPVVPGGVVYLTDGEAAASAACIRTSTGEYEAEHVCREVVAGVKHMPSGGPGYSNFIPLSACMDVNADYEGYYSMYQPQGCANTLSLYGIQVLDQYKFYPPSIEVYPVIDLPK